MKLHTKIIIIESVLIVLILSSLTYLYFKFKEKQISIKDAIPQLIELNNIKIPEPLYGPQSDISAGQLDADKIILFTNKEREIYEVKDLEKNELLTQAAKQKIFDMFDKQYFEHVSPIDGKDVVYFVNSVAYTYSYVGENLALGDFQDEKELVNAWMDSQGHRENILNENYTQIGVYAQKGLFNGRETWLAVQIFAKPALNCTMPNIDLKNKISTYNTDDLNSRVINMQDEAKSLLELGNQKINEGNQVYKETQDLSLAQPYWDEGESLQVQAQDKYDEANALIDDYNNIKTIIDEYNKQVTNYNNCLNTN